MAYVSQVEGSDGAAASVNHLDSAQIDAALHGAWQHDASQHNIPLQFNAPLHSVVVPDADLLFNGTYHRAGPDLVITGHDGQHFLVPSYFSSEHPPALMAPNGASLTGDVVSLMAGSPTPNHYAQTQPTTPPDAIGKVEKVVGDVTAVRNGVAVTLHVGDAVFKSDVVQTGAGSSVGISFPDGSAFNLVANTRMALTEYSYDPNSHSNEALMTLVQGTFAFVAGKVAHSGDMKIATPVATMGIRGTTGVVEQQPPGTVSANLGAVAYSFAVVKDFGTDINGAYTLCYLDPSTGDCNVFTTIGQIDYITTVTPLGVGQAPDVRVEPISNAQFAFEQEILQQLFQTLNPTNQQNNGSNGSSTFPGYVPPDNNPQLFQPPTFNFNFNYSPGGPGGTGGLTPTALVLSPPPTTPTTVVIWIGPSGNWVTPPDWNTGAVPGAGNPTVEILTPVTVTIDNAQVVDNLVLGPGAILDIIPGGSLSVFGTITGSGILQLAADGGDPTFSVNGTVTLSGGGAIMLSGSPSGDNNILGVASTNAKLVNINYTIEGAGNIGAGDGQLTFVNCATVNANVAGQTLDIHTGNTVENGDTAIAPGASPVMEATNGGTLRIEDNVSNLGLITALTGGVLQFENITVTNAATGAVQIGAGSTFDLDNSSALGGSFDNQGNVFVTGTSVLHGDTVTNEGNIYVGAHAALTLEGDSKLLNAHGALIQASGTSATITVELDAGANTNSGTMQAADGGEIIIDGLADDGVLENADGIIKADGEGAEVALTGATIVSGTVESSEGGVVETTIGTSTFENVTIADGSVIETLGGTFLNLEGTTTLGDTVTFEGAGTFVLTGDGAEIVGAGEGAGLDNKGTITGAGAIGNGGETSLNLRNEGTINANVADGTLTIDTGSTDCNTGTMKATNGGTLAIDDSVDNRGGIIGAFGTGSAVDLAGDITITGGTLATSDRRSGTGGMIEVLTAAVVLLDGTNAHAVTIDGYVKVDPGADLALAGAIHNDGTINVDTGKVGGSGSNLVIDGYVDLDGCGTVVLDGKGDNIIAGTGHAVLDNSNNIVGSGQIGTGDDSLKLVNEACGVIDANGNTSAPLIVDTGCVVICNSGTMEATDGGTLILRSDVDNNCGVIEAIGCGSTVELDGVTVTGGTLATYFGGLIEVTCGTSTFDDLAIIYGSNVLVDEGASLVLQGAIDNAGTITLASGFDDPSLIIDGGVGLNGPGTVVLSGADDHIIGGSDGGLLYNENHIVGSGTIGGHGLQLVNLADGVVDANGNSYAPLVLNTGCFVVDNAGLLESTGGGTLDIKSDVDNTYGTIASCGEGSDTELFGITVTNGTLATYFDGLIEVTCGTSTFDDLAIIYGSNVLVDEGASLMLQGAINNAGTITLASGFDDPSLIIDGGVGINGPGTVVLSGADDHIIGGSDGGLLYNENDILGSGTIGGHGLQLVNLADGRVDANGNSCAPLILDTGSFVVDNAGLLESTGGGTLDIKSDVDNVGGTIASSGEGSDTALFGITVTGGTLETRDHGTIEVVDSHNPSVFDGTGYHPVTVDGYVQVDDGAQLELQGSIDLTSVGIINVDEHQDGGQLIIDGTVDLNGCGSVVLSGNDDSIVGDYDGHGDGNNCDFLINGATISGYGHIGDERGDLFLTNNGTIDANVHGQSLVVDTENQIDNSCGTFEASQGGTLVVDDAVKGGDALIDGGTMLFDGKVDDVSVTFDNGTGAAKTYGDLVLGDWAQFSGDISGFKGTDAQHSDEITLVDFFGGHLTDSVSYNAKTGITTLTILDGHDSTSLEFVGQYAKSNFIIEQDGKNVDIFDPPTTASSGGTLATTPGGSGASNGYGMNLGNDQINLANPPAGQNGLTATPAVGSSTDNFVFHSALVNEGANAPSLTSEFVSNDGAGQPTAGVHIPVVTEATFDPTTDSADALTAQFHQVVASVAHLH